MFNLKMRRKAQFGSFWTQKVKVKEFQKRMQYLEPLCQNKTVLHFGCTDYPVFRPGHNLHIMLSSITKKLDGFDIDLAGIEVLKQYVDQPYYSKYTELDGKHYDICLIPETIEHVDNIKEFLDNLKFVNADLFVLTGPNCFSQEHFTRNTYKDGIFTEIVHPDHNCWFSPFTLKNAIEKYSGLLVTNTYLLENNTMVCCEAKRN